ncbi:MAG: polysaccharide deacetylase family protein [Magnetococcales bacterium]|nr:polysaccharide deacetylase family protein [Magnetococcales bacterium]
MVKRRIVRLVGVSVLLCWSAVTVLAADGPSKESRHLAKRGRMPFKTRYLYPGSGLAMEPDCLSRPEQRILALTFDDGPDKRDLAIGAVLEPRAIPATFFYVGERARAMPAIVEQMRAKGYEIAYHAYRHHLLSGFSRARLTTDFQQGVQLMQSLGITLQWFRPPYGDFNDTVVQTAQAHGMGTLLWTIDSRDWAGDSATTVAGNVVRRFHPGAILLFHSSRAASLRALPTILQAADKAHYRFVSLAEWQQVIQAAHCDQSPSALR